MRSSRQRFTEFREKIRKGLLEPHRYADPNQKPDETPNIGGRHDKSGPPNYKLKHAKCRLFSEYRVMLKGYAPAFLSLFVVLTLATAINMFTPVVLQLLIDYVATSKSLAEAPSLQFLKPLGLLPSTTRGSLDALALCLVAIALFSVAFEWMRMLAFQRLNYRLAGTLRQRLHEHLIRLPLSLLAEYKTGGIVSRIMGDVDQVVGGINNALVVPYTTMLRVVGIILALFFTNWRLASCIAVLIPPIALIHMALFRRLRPMWRNIQDDRSFLSARLTDMYSGIRVVRSFQRENSELKEFGAAQNTMIRKQQYTAVLGRLLGTGWGVFAPAIGVVIVWYGGILVLRGEMTVGKLVLFQSFIFMLINPITQLIDSFQNLQQNLGALDRVIDVLEQPIDMPDRPNAQPLTHPRGELELVDVHFGYTPEKDVLHGVSLRIPAGTMLAIVGPSGSGKTTLVNLVARFFDIDRGVILCDGRDIREITRDSYRAQFAMVLQDVYLFDGTVADNIAYGKRHASRADIMAAARQANAHEFIVEMEKGYDTFIGERGNKLSGGQKQRISIARAILADPKILILDEATSSLDSQSEHMIQESLRQLMVNRTTLVIAHRLSTIMHADRIVVLVDGRIVEQGSHEELLTHHGVYHSMFTQQFERHRDPALERIEWEPLADRKAS